MEKRYWNVLGALCSIGFVLMALSLRFIDNMLIVLIFFGLYIGLNFLSNLLIKKKQNKSRFLFSLVNALLINGALCIPILSKLNVQEAFETIPEVIIVTLALSMIIALFQTNFRQDAPENPLRSHKDEPGIPCYETPDVLMQTRTIYQTNVDDRHPIPSGALQKSMLSKVIIWGVALLIMSASLLNPFFWIDFLLHY